MSTSHAVFAVERQLLRHFVFVHVRSLTWSDLFSARKSTCAVDEPQYTLIEQSLYNSDYIGLCCILYAQNLIFCYDF